VPPGASRSSPVVTAMLGGDLNLRDEEVKAVQRELGDEAVGIADVWGFCGSPEASRWTWDTGANTNIGATYVCKTRFDRVLFISQGISDIAGAPGAIAIPKAKAKAKASSARMPEQSGGSNNGWRPASLSLVGKEKVPNLGRFPSDHWGVLTEWTLSGGSGPSAPAGRAEPAGRPAGSQGEAARPKVVPNRVVIDLDDD
ncbi:unnamed protein product, partial [Polarella glacialis]